MFFLGWIFFVKLYVLHQGRSINLDRQLVCPAHLFVVVGILGQRNPLTAEMSSEIVAKTSFIIIIVVILACIFVESIIF